MTFEMLNLSKCKSFIFLKLFVFALTYIMPVTSFENCYKSIPFPPSFPHDVIILISNNSSLTNSAGYIPVNIFLLKAVKWCYIG